MKRNYLTLFTLIFLSAVTSSFARDNRQQLLDSVFTDRTEVYFTFQIFSRDEIGTLTRIISIDNVKDREVFAYANRDEFAKFLDLGYSYTILTAPGKLVKESELNMGGDDRGPGSTTVWNFYPTYEQYVTYMTGFAAGHPAICRLDTIGITPQGRLILAVKISDSVQVRRSKPEFLFTSSIHGDELTGFICMMHLIDSLLSAYGTEPRITNLVNNNQIYINPLANPDGTYHTGNSSVYGAQRGNANGVDLNRNFADPKAGPHPDSYPWQAETRAFMHYDTIHHFVISANFHGGAEVLNYPWDTWVKFHPDDTWFQFICREYVDTVHLHAPYGYLNDLDNGITNGNAWYEINGGRQDYTTYFHFGREVTMEISSTKLPPSSQLLNFWEYHRRSLLNYIEQCNYGINGRVTDTATGAALNAKVFISGHDADNSFEYSNSGNGWYYRPIAQGTWDLTYSLFGYHEKTVHGIPVTNRQTTRLDVKLVPLDFGVGGISARALPLLYPNPSDGNIKIMLPDPASGSYPFSVFDMTGKEVHSGTIGSNGKQGEVTLDLTSLAGGIYLLKLDGNGVLYENKVIIR
jgi:hypothetical protein